MTPNAAVTLILDRVGLAAMSTSYRAQALLYLNAVMHDIEGRPGGGWWWLKRRSTITMVDGQRLYDLASTALYPIWMRDSTNNRSLETTMEETVIRRDPDLDEDGDPLQWYPAGINTTTGANQVGLYPIPSASGTVAYGYYAFLADLTNPNDATSDFVTTYGIPAILQPSLWEGAAKLYLEETGDLEAALACQAEYERGIKYALRINERQRGNMRLRLGRPHAAPMGSTPTYQPEEGSLA